jgi:tetratricopeptide (TPR) repeat protein
MLRLRPPKRIILKKTRANGRITSANVRMAFVNAFGKQVGDFAGLHRKFTTLSLTKSIFKNAPETHEEMIDNVVTKDSCFCFSPVIHPDMKGRLDSETKKVYLDKLQKIEHQKIANQTDACLLQQSANLKMHLGDYEGARHDLRDANELEPDNCMTHTLLGIVCSHMNDEGGALIHFNRAMEMHPDDPFILYHRGELHYQMCRYAAALEDFNKAAALVGNHPLILSYRGATYYHIGNYSESLHDLNIANSTFPNDLFILKNRGAAQVYTLDYQGALTDLKRAAELRK